VLLHGAGAGAAAALAPLRDLADDAGLILLAPKSRRPTWDVIRGGFGPDVATIDALVEHVFERFAVDRTRVALAASRTAPPTPSASASRTAISSRT